MGLGLVQILFYRSAEGSILAERRLVCYLGHTLHRERCITTEVQCWQTNSQ